ncbi:MAG: D-tyrosyl-tRNA(Tyr) deacylase [Bacteroidales bacterium 36-12]|nr:MAG: D-tyrosyl-tRNA(Tyr) deacylase [Bacteroidales bacterium 36-12]
MRVVIQRVKEASVAINNKIKSSIGIGLMVLLGIETDDQTADADWLIAKIVNLRIFDDEKGVMNLSIKDVNGEILIISQFTLHASTRKGNRPSYIKAARPETAIPLYEYFCKKLEEQTNTNVKTGEFGADMQVSLINDGPVTIIIDSKTKE